MESVILKPIVHQDSECIGIFFDRNKQLQSIIQTHCGAKWSRTKKCWYVLLSKNNYKALAQSLSGKATLRIEALRDFLLTRNRMVQFQTSPDNSETQATKKSNKPFEENKHPTLCDKNKRALEQFRQKLILKSYSPSTIRTYTNEFVQFLKLIREVPACDLQTERLKDYLQYCHSKLKLSENTLHSRMNALKFYYEQVLHQEKFFWDIPRPKKPFILPKLLNEKELINLFNALENKKHKAMLFKAYSSGLRVSEIVHLRLADIDSSRMQILIQRGKGKKDRYVNLSAVLLDILRKYISV